MLDEIQFSERGDSPSTFELRLLLQSASESPWLVVGRRLVQELGEQAGAVALVCVLDEIGGEKLHVSTRRHFFEGLWRLERDGLIVDLAARRYGSFSDIGRLLGVSKEYVRKVVARKAQPQRTTHRPGRGRHVAHD